MTDGDRKEIASRFWKYMGEQRFADAGDLLAPNAVFGGRGTPSTPMSRQFPLICEIYKLAPISHHDIKIFADGKDVAYNAKGRSTLPSGEEYNNDYVFMMEIEDDLIQSIKEYSDTAYAGSVLFPALPPDLIERLLS